MSTIMIIEDDERTLESIRLNLEKENHKAILVRDGTTGLAKAKEILPDLIIVDLPNKDCFDICQKLRSNPRTVLIPIIILSESVEIEDKILGFEAGADDYVTKPFNIRELMARVKTNTRHWDNIKKSISIGDSKKIWAKDLVIRIEKYQVELKGVKLNLLPKEFEILLVLASNPGQIFSRNFLIEKIWGFKEKKRVRLVDVYITNLRKKIERDLAKPEYIETIWGVGYRFNEKKS